MLDYDTEIFARLVIIQDKARLSEAMDISLERISEAINKIEQKSGTVLIDRDNDKITLTPEGQEYYEKIIDLLERLADEK